MDGRSEEDGWTLERLRDAVVPPSGLRACSGAALHGLLAAAVEAVGPGPFGGIARTPAFLRGLEALLDELAVGSVSPTTLAEAAERMGAPGGRLAHLGKLVEVCFERLAAAAVELPSARWLAASATLARGWPESLAVARVEVTATPPFPPGVVGFLGALARAASAAGRTLAVHVPLTGDAAHDAVLEPLLQAFEAGPDLAGVEAPARACRRRAVRGDAPARRRRSGERPDHGVRGSGGPGRPAGRPPPW